MLIWLKNIDLPLKIVCIWYVKYIRIDENAWIWVIVLQATNFISYVYVI